MQIPLFKPALLTFGLALLTSAAPVAAAASSYTITNLGTLGGNDSFARGLNNRGDVVGSSGESAFLYSDGAMRDLGRLPTGGFAVAYGVNDARQVTGYNNNFEPGGTRAFLYQNGVLQDVGTFGAENSLGFGINQAGQIAGSISGPDGFRAFLTGPSGTQILPTLGSNYSEARGLNDAGQVVGGSTRAGEFWARAYVYSDGVMRDLGTLGGRGSQAWGINNAGFIVGAADTAGDVASHAFLYRNGAMQDLGTLGGQDSFAYDINNANAAVGYSDMAEAGRIRHAVLFKDGSITDLSVLPEVQAAGWEVLTYAAAINELGQITGSGVLGGQTRAFLLTPTLEVPEPSALLLVLAGALALAGARKQRS